MGERNGKSWGMMKKERKLEKERERERQSRKRVGEREAIKLIEIISIILIQNKLKIKMY